MEKGNYNSNKIANLIEVIVIEYLLFVLQNIYLCIKFYELGQS